MVTWSDPVFPNGEITNVALDRRERGKAQITVIATFLPTDDTAFIDVDQALSPHTQYKCRLRMLNRGGEKQNNSKVALTLSSCR